MRYTLTISEEDQARLSDHLFSDTKIERAAYLLCRISKTPEETRLLVREVIPVEEGEVTAASPTHMEIPSRSFTRAMKKADQKQECFVFVHSHPLGHPSHSPQDDSEETKLFRTAYIRIRTEGVHASIVFSNPGSPTGRVWLENGSTAPIERIRVIGNRFRYYFHDGLHGQVPEFFDRQVRAFGRDIQALLSKLHVGVVGTGGTGSAVTEQLIRLGVGTLTVVDGEEFERSNINRVYGSRMIDDGIPKVKLMERLAAEIGLGTDLRFISKPNSFRSVLEEFRNCDVIFGCTDDELGRSLLTRFAIYYYIPVFDMGVKIDSHEGAIHSIQGRVTTLLPSTACLNCRRRIQPERVRAESIQAVNPEEAEHLREEGYAPELEDPAPAVIPFTSTVASSALTEFLHRLTGFMGEDRVSSEVLHLIDQTRVRTNRQAPQEDCFCGDRLFWGRGDVEPLLDTTWRPE